MIPPTSIDGTDITGATIDGQDVKEITVDGQTVFSAAKTLPVAYSNLVAWYPFDSAEYGGSNADDVTALVNPGQSGDSTAYDLNVNGATYQATGGVTDVNAGANSGAFDFDGSNDNLLRNSGPFDGTGAISVTCWIKTTQTSNATIWDNNHTGFSRTRLIINQDGINNNTLIGNLNSNTVNGPETVNNPVLNDGNYHHLAVALDSSLPNNGHFIVDGGSPENMDSSFITGDKWDENQGINIGINPNGNTDFDGEIDDVRFYNKGLTQSEINQIYQNTKP